MAGWWVEWILVIKIDSLFCGLASVWKDEHVWEAKIFKQTNGEWLVETAAWRMTQMLCG